MNPDFAEFVRELIEALKRGWEEFFSDRRGDAEILLDWLRGTMARDIPQSDLHFDAFQFWFEEIKKTLDELYRRSKLEQVPSRVLDCVERYFWPLASTFASEREEKGLDLPPPELVAGDLFLACFNRCL